MALWETLHCIICFACFVWVLGDGVFDDGRRDLPGCPEGYYRGDLDRLSAGLTVSPSLQIPSHHPCQTTLSTLPLRHKQTHTHAEPNGRYYTNVHQGFDCTSFRLSGSVSNRAAEGLSSHYVFCFHATSAKCTDCSPKFQSEALNAADTQQVRECLYVFFCWCAVSSCWGGVVSWKVLLSDGR